MQSLVILVLGIAAAAAADDSVVTCEMKMPVPDAESVDCSIPGVKQNCCAFVKCVADGGPAAEDQCATKFKISAEDQCPVLHSVLSGGEKLVQYCPKLKEMRQKQTQANYDYGTCDFQVKIPKDGKTHTMDCGIPGVKKECCAFAKCSAAAGDDNVAQDKCESDSGITKKSDCPVLSSVMDSGPMMGQYCKMKDDSVETCEMKLPVPDAGSVDCSIPGVKKNCCAFVKCVADGGPAAQDQCAKKFDAHESSCPILQSVLTSGEKLVQYCPKLKEMRQKHAANYDYGTCDFQMNVPHDGKTHTVACGIPGVKKECCAFVKCSAAAGDDNDAQDKCKSDHGITKKADCPVLSSVMDSEERMGEYCKMKESAEQSNKEESSRLFGQSQSAQVPQRHEYVQHMGLIVGGAGLMGFVVLAAVLRRVTTGSVTGSAREFDAENSEQEEGLE